MAGSVDNSDCIWRLLIQQGFSTFPEYPELNTRSDCHAWSAYPAYEMFSIICGIQITEPGFTAVKIQPDLNDLDWVKAKLPWKDSFIELELSKNNKLISGLIVIPNGLKTELEINGDQKILKEGRNYIE